MHGLIGHVFFVVSVLSGAASLILHSFVPFTEPSFATSLATILWIVCIMSFGIWTFRLPGNQPDQTAHGNRILKALFPVVLAVAFVLRLFKITHQGIESDEWYWLMQAREIIAGRFLSPFSFIGDQPSNIAVYPVAVMLLATANNYLAVRLPGIFYSLGTLAFVFLLLKEAVSPKAAVFGLVLLATSVWDIHNSQIGLQNVTINPFLISGFMYFLHTGCLKRSYRRMFAAGVFLGLSLNLLYVAALSAFAFAVYAVPFLVRQKGHAVKLLLVAAASCLLTFAPTIPKIIRFPERSLGRHGKFTAENIARSRTEHKAPALYYAEETLKLFQDFRHRENAYGNHYLWGITLEPLVTALVAVGALSVLVRILRPLELLITTEFILMAVPVVVLYRATSIWREYAFLPVIYMLAGIGSANADGIIRRLSVRFIRKEAVFYVLYAAVYGVSLFWVSGIYWRSFLSRAPDTYFTHCRHIYEFVPRVLTGGETVYLQDELCSGFISLFLPGNVKTERFKDSIDLKSRLRDFHPALVVKLAPEIAKSDKKRAENLADFLEGIIDEFPESIIRYITGTNGTIEAAIIMVR